MDMFTVRRGNFVCVQEETLSACGVSHLHTGLAFLKAKILAEVFTLSWPSHNQIQLDLLKSCQCKRREIFK